MQELTFTTIINRPAKEVFEFTLNPENTPKWVDGVVIEETNETSSRLGTIYRNKDQDGNWRVFEVTAFEPDQMFELTKKDDNHHVRYTFNSLDDYRCELEYYVWTDDSELRGMFNKKTIMKILAKLKTVIEKDY